MAVNKNEMKRAIACAGAAFWFVFLVWLSWTRVPWQDGLIKALAVFTGPLSSQMTDILRYLAPAAAIGILSFLVWLALKLFGLGSRSSVALAFAVSLAFTAFDALFTMLQAGSGEFGWLLEIIGAAAALLMVTLYEVARRRYPKLVNGETVSYVVFGVLTTLVNFLIFFFCVNSLRMHYAVANVLAWVGAVIFAYVVNKWYVFQSRDLTVRAVLREMALFFGARLTSLLLELGFLYLFITLLRMSETVAKVICAVVVLVTNYIFSKWVIFKQPSESPEPTEPSEPEQSK